MKKQIREIQVSQVSITTDAQLKHTGANYFMMKKIS